MLALRAEFHIHTVLSPCAEVEMLPPLIVAEAQARGIDWIAITDHNSSANVAAVMEAAQGSGVSVLPGMELETLEEVHLLCLFPDLDALARWQTLVDTALPNLPNQPDYFGEQYVVDKTGDFIRHEERLLITATRLSLETACWQVNQLGGLAIPAHVNRTAYGLFPVLGFLPPDLEVAALEISRHTTPEKVCQDFPQIGLLPLIQSGDVHRLDEFLGAVHVNVYAPTLAELWKALRGEDGRSLQLLTT